MSAILLLALRILLAAALYGFLGFAFYTLWRDLKHESQLLAARQPPPITLVTLLDSPPVNRQFSTPEITLGREPSCEFSIQDQTVSSRHARLTYRQQQWWLEDMASTNGTFLNGDAVTAPVVVTHGDEVRLGQVGLRIEISPFGN